MIMKKDAVNAKIKAIQKNGVVNIPVPQNEADYQHLMTEIEQLVKSGDGVIKNEDMVHYASLANAAAAYEYKNYTIPAPKTIEGLLEWKMYELRLKQKGLADKLHVSDTKLSLIMSGKQKPDVTLLKNIHKELGIDGNVLLSVI